MNLWIILWVLPTDSERNGLGVLGGTALSRNQRGRRLWNSVVFNLRATLASLGSIKKYRGSTAQRW